MAEKRKNARRFPSGQNRNEVSEVLRRVDPAFTYSSFKTPFIVGFPKGLIGIPDCLRVALKYNQSNSFSASPTPAGQAFTVNSAYDLDNTGTGHQPSYYDFFNQVYNRYCVLGCSVVFEIENATASVAVDFAAVYSDSDVSGQSVQFLRECNRSKAALVGPASAINVKRVVMPAVSIAQIMGQKDVQPDSNMYAGISASPTDLAWCVYRLQASDALTNVTVRVKTTILVDVMFKDVNPAYAS